MIARVAATALALAALGSTPSPATAATAKSRLSLSGVSPLTSEPVGAVWRADRKSKISTVFWFEVRVTSTDPRYPACNVIGKTFLRRRWREGERLRYRVRPGELPGTDARWWCTGPATLRVRSRAGGVARTHATVRFRIREDASNPAPNTHSASIRVVDGSSLSVKFTCPSSGGRQQYCPERKGTLAGTLTGVVQGRYKAGAETRIDITAGGLTITLPPYPFCTSNDRTYPSPVGLKLPLSLSLSSRGQAVIALELLEDPAVLTGCQAPVPATPANLLFPLAGTLGVDGLARFPLSGTRAGIALANNRLASVQLDLVVTVEIAGG